MANNLACHAGDVVLLRARSSESEVTGPTCASKLARVVRLAFGHQLQQPHRLNVVLTHRMKPLGHLDWNDPEGHAGAPNQQT
jgi:hypothetical protein